MTPRPAALLLPWLTLLSGCFAVGPDYAPPPLPDSVRFQTATDAVSADEPPEKWWSQLADPVLDRLIGQALQDNLDLKIASANLAAARATRDAAFGRLFPALDSSAAYARSRESAATQLGEPNIAAPDVNLTQGAVGLSWEVDLIGRVRRTLEAANADTAQSEALRRQVLTILIADVAATYIDLRGAQLRLEVARRNADNQRATYDLTLTLSDAGRGTDLDVARARAQLESTLATLPPLQAQVTADRHHLAVLLGQPVNGLDALLGPAAALPAVPAFVAVGSPTTLLRRRPDVSAAERGVAAATARIGVATADLYPTVSFSATAGLQALQPADLGRKGAFTYGVGPSLSLPLFDLGVYARLRGANANQRAQLASFTKTVLTALAETETALDAYQEERQRLRSLTIAAEASGQAAALATTRYRFGAENFLSVLDAEARQLAAEDLKAQSDTAVALDLVTIYRALGGGWTVMPVAAED